MNVATVATPHWLPAVAGLGTLRFASTQQGGFSAHALYYTELSPEEAMAMDGKLTPLQKFLRSGIFAVPGEEIPKNALIAKIAEKKICGLDKARKQVVELLISDGLV